MQIFLSLRSSPDPDLTEPEIPDLGSTTLCKCNSHLMCTPPQCPVFYTSCMGFSLCLKILATLYILSRLLAIFFLLRHGVDVTASIWPSFCFFSDFLCQLTLF